MSKNKKTKAKKKGSVLSTVILVLILLIGVGIMLYPTVSDWWNSFHQSRAIASYANVVENTDTETMEAMLEAARDYNRRLLSKPNRYTMNEEEQAEYESLLDISGTGVMGYVQIDKIGVSLPIYHGTDEAVLQIAIGHIEGTSLPVGGESTHTVLSGHRGLPSARLFTDLDKMAEGDTFTVTVLNQTCTYEVDQIRIVLPEEISELDIVSGEDLCTLVTCTPYGVNSHRLLVRGHRIENIEGEVAVVAGAVRIPNYVTVPAVAIPLLFLFLLGMMIFYRRRRPRIREEEMEAYHAIDSGEENKTQSDAPLSDAENDKKNE